MPKIASLPQRLALSPADTPERVAELSVVIPTFNEAGNVAPLLERLDAALTGIAWEAIFVDDNSPDGTARIVKDIGREDARVHCLHRVGRRGLAGACIEGMLSSNALFVAVIDADLQHDEKVLAQMLTTLKSGAYDLVVGSRYMAGGNAASFSKGRGAISRGATLLSKKLARVEITDPMSGFFMMRRDRFDALAPKLSTHGFKILFDIVVTARGGLRIAELPYVFGTRQSGESKLDAQVGLDFLGLLLAKLTGGVITPRFVSFALVGVTGLAVHLTAQKIGLSLLGLEFARAYVFGAFVAMTNNFLLNNVLTYRDRKLAGFAILKGLIGFYAISSVGLLAGAGVSSWLYYGHDSVWWLASAAGALMGAVWNYSMSTLLVWRVK